MHLFSAATKGSPPLWTSLAKKNKGAIQKVKGAHDGLILPPGRIPSHPPSWNSD